MNTTSLLNQKVTEHFNFYEFRPHDTPGSWMPENDYQTKLIINLAKNIEVIRQAMPSNCSIFISSGVRTKSDYDRLKASGYNPSDTSDHFFGFAVPIDPSNAKYKKFGPTYNFSVGAADCIPNGMSIQDFFKLACEKTRSGVCRFGQVIHEYDPSSKKEWVHLGGDYTAFFEYDIVRFLGKTQFLTSVDGGKTYNTMIF